LDVMEALNWDPARAARMLECSSSQLIKLLKTEPRALQSVNEARQSRQLHQLK
jgi:hypothetical protein